MSFELSGLNDEQKAAVLATEGAVLVTAGAGSGKTRLLTHRIAYLIEEKGVKPYNILAITFTNKAANEMKERLERMIPEAYGLWVSTFHAMCVKILRRYIDRLGYKSSFSIYGEQEKDNVLKKLIQKAVKDNVGWAKGADAKEVDRLKKRASYIISDAKNAAQSPDRYNSEHLGDDEMDTLCEIYSLYDKELKNNNALDFDDLLVKTFLLLKNDAEVREYYRNKFRYIHVDEFQDTNVVQYLLIKMLAYPSGNVLVVGDEDQCIYGWRGANIGNMLEFRKDFDCKLFKLERNYRSTKKILALANSVIANNIERLDKTLWTAGAEGENVTAFCARNETNEAEYVANVIKNLVESGDYEYKDFAVLMRLNALSRTFEERFLAYGIPHKMYGGFKFFERKEIKDILAYLRLLMNPNDVEALLRVINFPKRGIGESAVAQLVNYCSVTGRPVTDVVMNIESNPDLPLTLIKKITPFKNVLACLVAQLGHKPHEIVEYLVRLLNLNEVYGDDTEENMSRRLNISYFVESVKQYEASNPDATIEDYMQMISLYSDIDEMSDENDSVCLATVHSVKGLEFKVVFVIACEEGVLPLSRSMEDRGGLEEERRLMYVAVTRAMERLYLTWTATRFMYNERKMTLPSRFLKEAGLVMRSSQPSAYESRERAREYQRETDRSYGYGSYGYSSGRTDPYADSYSADKVYPVYTAAAKPRKQDKNLGAFKVGTVVVHRKFGRGTILTLAEEAGGTYAQIDFEKVGKMLLSLQYAPLEIIEQ